MARDRTGTTDNDRHAATRGFSLTELLIALTILALATTLVTVTIGRRGGGFQVQASAAEIRDLLRETRQSAQSAGTPAAMRFDEETRTFQALADRRVVIPDGLDVTVVSAQSAGAGTIVFFPDGSASGGTITVRDDNVSERLSIDWLTSKISRGGSP